VDNLPCHSGRMTKKRMRTLACGVLGRARRDKAGGAMLRVRSPQDLGAGVVFVVIGLAGIYFGSNLAMGTAARMGPGYFPVMLSYLIVALGLVVSGRAFATDGPDIEPIHLRPIFFVIASLLIFGLLIDQAGLAITTVVLTVVAAYARREVNLIETLLLGAGLALFTIAVFVYGLNQPLPAWWGR
jgi:hypothetical protein